MTIRSILVNLDVDTDTQTIIAPAVAFARRFDAVLIGVAAGEPSPSLVGLEAGPAGADLYAWQRDEIERTLKAAEAAFTAAIPHGVKAEWRSFLGSPTLSVASAARAADIVLTHSETRGAFDALRKLDVGALVLSAGRPVLTVGADVTAITTDNIVIGWKDTREARRAVVDALPLLEGANQITAVTVSEGTPEDERDSLSDLVTWLDRHGIKAKSELLGNSDTVAGAADAHGADLVVTGGYGHSRLREWMFGGVTRSLLDAHSRNRLFSN